MKSDTAQSLFTTGDIGKGALKISDWHEVGSSASNAYDSQNPVLAVVLFDVNMPCTYGMISLIAP